MYALSATTTFVVITIVGGLPFLVAAVVIAFLYYSGAYHPWFRENRTEGHCSGQGLRSDVEGYASLGYVCFYLDNRGC